MKNEIERFEENYIPEPNTGCWLWIGPLFYKRRNYGRFSLNKKYIRAHRYSYRLHNGNFDKNLIVMHKCDIPQCVNPCHLSLGSVSDNNLDKMKKGRCSRLSGEINHNSKLTDKIVLIMRDLYSSGDSIKSISGKYPQYSYFTIWDVCKRRSWRHI